MKHKIEEASAAVGQWPGDPLQHSTHICMYLFSAMYMPVYDMISCCQVPLAHPGRPGCTEGLCLPYLA